MVVLLDVLFALNGTATSSATEKGRDTPDTGLDEQVEADECQ